MCLRARKQKIMQKFDRRIRTCALGRGRERKGEACLLTLHLLELDIRTPACGSTRGRDLTRSRGGASCEPGKNGGFPFIILKPRAEGYETEIVANFAFWGPINRFTCMRNPKHLMHLLCGSSRAMKRVHGGWQRRNSMALHREENKVPLRQSPKCKWINRKR